MRSLVLSFNEIDQCDLAIAGGKGVNLAALSRIDGVQVPKGFCISAGVFSEVVETSRVLPDLIHRLSLPTTIPSADLTAIAEAIRKEFEAVTIPGAAWMEIERLIESMGAQRAYAVRSSATAEDLPGYSFAGLQESFLNVIGAIEIGKHIRRCWASLFSERAIVYRMQHGFDHRRVQMAVIIQEMILPLAAGIVFTADPISGNRKITSIDASFGLGEALVSGKVNPDRYAVKDNRIIASMISSKNLAVYGSHRGGTYEQPVPARMQHQRALSDEQILELSTIARKIEHHFAQPQDIEWCLQDGTFYIVQARPITTLFPLPESNDDAPHVFISVGHQQMMTDPISPLGLSVRSRTGPRMYEAAGRQFVDIAADLLSPARRPLIVGVLGQGDPLIKDALDILLERDEFDAAAMTDHKADMPPKHDFRMLVDYDPKLVSELIENSESSVLELRKKISQVSGAAVFDFIADDIQLLNERLSDRRSFGMVMTGMNASSWVNEKIYEWLGEKNVADILALSVPHNITSQMGLDLLDVADSIRDSPAVVNYLRENLSEDFMERLPELPGGKEFRVTLATYLEKYGMRCAGEIDIARTRWAEKPAILVPMILSNLEKFPPGESKRKFEHGKIEAQRKEKELSERLLQLPDGEEKAREAKRMIGLIRNFSGYREYPKYEIVSRYFEYKKALLREARLLVGEGAINAVEDVYFLRFEEFRNAVLVRAVDQQLINGRKADYKRYEHLAPPRVMTAEGEIISGKYKRDHLPVDALVGLPVSSGFVEGRARIILKLEEANFEEGDILVTTFTDPSWTPVFLAVKGLVTEVGGLMTHGAVIAREYGLPAVVGVENATKRIKDGQRIRVHGTEGYVEIL